MCNISHLLMPTTINNTIDKIPLSPVSFKSTMSGTYKKGFGEIKQQLKAANFPISKTHGFVASLLTEKSLNKLNKHIDSNTIFLAMPKKHGANIPNIIPKIYAEQLSAKTGNKHLDLSNYLEFRQATSARKAYTAQSRAKLFFNIAFKSPSHKADFIKQLEGKNAMLVDDVLTTGETFVAMATYLKQKHPKLDIKGANALVAVDNRTPTPRDIQRVATKLIDVLPRDSNLKHIETTVVKSTALFTRKKLMRFELGIKTPEGALQQFRNMKDDIAKMQISLSESIAGSLIRYPLNQKELAVIKDTPTAELSTETQTRLLHQFYPNAVFSKAEGNAFRLFSNPDKTKELSNGVDYKSPVDALRSAIPNIQQSIVAQQNTQNLEQGKTQEKQQEHNLGLGR